jgi:hypothetical protein
VLLVILSGHIGIASLGSYQLILTQLVERREEPRRSADRPNVRAPRTVKRSAARSA